MEIDTGLANDVVVNLIVHFENVLIRIYFVYFTVSEIVAVPHVPLGPHGAG